MPLPVVIKIIQLFFLIIGKSTSAIIVGVEKLLILNRYKQQSRISTGVTVNVGDKAKVNVSATGFVTQQQTGSNAGQTSVGFKAAVDATFVSKTVPLINTPALKVSTSTQTTVGGSVTQQYRFPW